MSSDPSENKPPRGPGGKFAKGNKLGHRFKKGEASNPGGRPRDSEFRLRCREVAKELLEKIQHADPSYASGSGGGGTDIAGLVRAFEAVSDRGGYLTADKQAAVETAQGRMVLAAMALQQLSPDQRQKLIEMWQTMFRGETPPLLDSDPDSNK